MIIALQPSNRFRCSDIVCCHCLALHRRAAIPDCRRNRQEIPLAIRQQIADIYSDMTMIHTGNKIIIVVN